MPTSTAVNHTEPTVGIDPLVSIDVLGYDALDLMSTAKATSDAPDAIETLLTEDAASLAAYERDYLLSLPPLPEPVEVVSEVESLLANDVEGYELIPGESSCLHM